MGALRSDEIDLSWATPMSIEQGVRRLTLLLANAKLAGHFSSPEGDEDEHSTGAQIRAVEAQQRDGWYCWGCAAWLPAGKGVIRSRWPKFLGFGTGLYCDKKCAP